MVSGLFQSRKFLFSGTFSHRKEVNVTNCIISYVLAKPIFLSVVKSKKRNGQNRKLGALRIERKLPPRKLGNKKALFRVLLYYT